MTHKAHFLGVNMDHTGVELARSTTKMNFTRAYLLQIFIETLSICRKYFVRKCLKNSSMNISRYGDHKPRIGDLRTSDNNTATKRGEKEKKKKYNNNN